ncbi:hypothetical protein [Paratissierella segnis]|uniref:Uncharacterized protein n=1 Tax=Paratissierella segnis TaxID=2763679 RepID=A0A926EWP6_9FIRM|nr:hypothetical protein [Paratissierella segnis]MBC8587620.1 hypothetical protein [Paratissierella segnis]
MENNIVSLDNFRLKKIEHKQKSSDGFCIKDRKEKIYLDGTEVEVLINFLDEFISFLKGNEEKLINENEWGLVEDGQNCRRECKRIKKVIKDNMELYEDYAMLERDDISFLFSHIYMYNSSIDIKKQQKNLEKYKTVMDKFNEKLKGNGRPLI